MNDSRKDKTETLKATALDALTSGRIKEALSLYEQLLAITSADIEVLNNLGLIHLDQGRYTDAMKCFEKAIGLKPETASLHYNLGLTLHKQEDMQGALHAYLRALNLNPDYKEVLQNLGSLYKRMGKAEPAAACYERLLQLEPKDENARYMLDVLRGGRPAKAPRAYITDLFDAYANDFEAQLVGKLGYLIPEKLRQAFAMFSGDHERFDHLLDLGCGTGLVAKAFQHTANKMTGVDLSGKMVAQAKLKGGYDQLFQTDIREFLKASSHRYDLVVAADVLIYLGTLDDFFPLVAGRMARGGYFLFSTEDSTDMNDVCLLPSGRYGHGPMYVQARAGEHGFVVRLCQGTRIRKEAGRWITGNLYILEYMR